MEQNTYEPDYNSEATPFIVKDLRPRIYLDNGKWCALYGDDPQSGIFGSGATPEEAMQAFERDWNDKKQNSVG